MHACSDSGADDAAVAAPTTPCASTSAENAKSGPTTRSAPPRPSYIRAMAMPKPSSCASDARAASMRARRSMLRSTTSAGSASCWPQ
jgi:hypothetical protein